MGNPGPGGYGAVLLSGPHRKELSQGFRLTTNNRMELTAVIEALNLLKTTCEADIYTDSQYVMKGATEWLAGWVRNSWRTADKKPVKNSDLWQDIYHLNKKHTLRWHWVKGHAGHPENERCDHLATTAADTNAVLTDPGVHG